MDSGDNIYDDDNESKQTFLMHKENEEDEASAENDDATADNSNETGEDDYTESTSRTSIPNSRIQETTFLKALLESFPDVLRAFQEAFDKGEAVCDVDDEDTDDSNNDRSSPTNHDRQATTLPPYSFTSCVWYTDTICRNRGDNIILLYIFFFFCNFLACLFARWVFSVFS